MSLLDDALKEMDMEFDTGESPCGGVDDEPGKLVDFHRLRNQQEEQEEIDDMEMEMNDDGEDMDEGKDIVQMDVPFMIRIFELVREDIKSDEDLHHVADKILDLSGQGPLTMDHYADFREFESGDEDMEADMGGDMEDPEGEENQGFEPDAEPDMHSDISVESLLFGKD